MTEEREKDLHGPKADEKQTGAITCSENAVVSAGAGSGKTYVLTERFFTLVQSGKAEVDQILTLTFTKKAASEMFERIYRRLLWSQDGSEHLREQVRKFDQAQISTLDSFCAQIARTGAGLFGITPDFSIDNPGTLDLAQETALRFLLQNSDDPVLQRYFVNYSFEGVWKNFFAAYGYKHVSIARETDFTAMEEKQREYLKARFQHHGRKMLSAGRDILSLDINIGKSVQTNQEALACIDELEAAIGRGDFEETLKLTDSAALSKKGISRNSREELVRLGNYIDTFKEHRKPLSCIAGTLAHWNINTAVFHLLRRYEQELREEKRKLGICGFYDVLTLAIETLRRNRTVRDYFKSVFRYIMIDEFQDNNGMQKQLLYLLGEKQGLFHDEPQAEDLEEGKLFFVGDDKQSIYRFRGADVSVFKDLCRELAGGKGTHITMEKNYRSNPGLIDFYNDLFQSVLSSDDALKPYEAEFLPLSAGGTGPEVVPDITVFYKPFDDKEDTARFASGDETEAYHLAEYVRGHVENGTLPLRDGEAVRPAGYSDFALLMRSTGSQAVYERIFRQFGIPYTTDNVRTLFLEAPFNDIYNLLQLVLFPSDRIAYAGLLRSPLAGCSDETMLNLLLIEGEEGPFPKAADSLEMDPADRERYAAAKELFEFLQKKTGAWTIGKIVRYIWYEQGYRYLLLTNPAYHPYLEYFDYLYYLAVDADRKGLTLSEFLDFMRRNLGKYERLEDLDILKNSSEGVRIVTIHKSKGLEFPVVLLANTGNVGNRGAGAELFYVSPEYGITFNGGESGGRGDNYFYTLMADEYKMMETAEVKRLLYVACTRAKDHLCISGYHHRNNRNTDDAMLNMILKAADVSPETSAESGGAGGGAGCRILGGGAVLRTMAPVSRSSIRSRPRDSGAGSIGAKIEMYENRPVLDFDFFRRDFSVTELAEYQLAEEGGGSAPEGRELPIFDWEEELRETAAEEGYPAAFGTLAHYIMEQKIRNTYTREDIPEQYVSAFPAALLPRIVAGIEEMAGRFFAAPLAEQLRRACRIETEFDFISRYAAEDKEYFVFGRMDVYFETETAAYVVDFKTDRLFVPSLHNVQLQLYAKAAEALSGKKPECMLFFLRDGSVHSVVPDLSFIPAFPGKSPA